MEPSAVAEGEVPTSPTPSPELAPAAQPEAQPVASGGGDNHEGGNDSSGGSSDDTNTEEPTAERIATGEGGTLQFSEGDAVFGLNIVLESGEVCEGTCYLPSAPSGGAVTTGVINPWDEEIADIEPTEFFEADGTTEDQHRDDSPVEPSDNQNEDEVSDQSQLQLELTQEAVPEEVDDPVSERVTTGEGGTLTFEPGEPVVGWRIEYEDGSVCDNGNCYNADPEVGGTVTSGVINPYPGEIPEPGEPVSEAESVDESIETIEEEVTDEAEPEHLEEESTDVDS